MTDTEISNNPITAQFRQKNPKYLEGLNEQQNDAVTTIEGPLLVLAGAGTGKTRVLTTRIAHILASNLAKSSEILSVTFTNKAALEMRQRVAFLIGASAEGMAWLGTFHSIGAKILRRHAELVDLKSDFTILDTDDQIRLIKQLLKGEQQLLEELDDDIKKSPSRHFAAIIDSWKNRALLPKDIKPNMAGSFANGLGHKLYQDYQARLQVLNAADFGDLLLLCIKLFRENPDILAIYHRRFKYILVDEYQDSNVAQYLWLRLLAQGKPANEANICVVGDDDQSIYGWRGAEIDNILRFEKDFPGAKTIKLEMNYRSTSHILNCAASVIANNEGRLDKTLFSASGEDGEKVSVSPFWGSEDEARHVAGQIEQLQRKENEQLNEMAILVRTSAQMLEFENIFIERSINYRVIGGNKFYERREIRDAMAYLRITYQQSYDLALERIINVPKRGLGNATIQMIIRVARSQNIPMLQAIRLLIETEELGKKQRETLSFLVSQFEDWNKRAANTPPFELAEEILDESGYTDMWKQEKSADAPGRLENLKELINSMQKFDTMGEFLEYIALVLERSDKNKDAVSIMTLHAAKGLEFNNVFLAGWEEGLFPSQMSLDENGNGDLEEERRLAYVGITRAKKRSFISLAQNRRIHGLTQSALPSRFLDELPTDSVIVSNIELSNNGDNYSQSNFKQPSKYNKHDPLDDIYDAPNWKRMRANSPKTINADFEEVPSANSSAFRKGMRVTHLKFGQGTISNVEGKKLAIDFDSVGRKKVLDNFVKISE